MRDERCDKKTLEVIINCNPGFISEDKQKIEDLLEDESKGIQRFPNKNRDIIRSVKTRLINDIGDIMHAQYSYGMDMNEFDTLFDDMLMYATDEDVVVKEIGYINLLYLFAYCILLQKDVQILAALVRKMDKEEINDILLDCFIEAYGLERAYHSDEYYKDNPYKYLVEIIDSAYSGQEGISDLLQNYVTKEWLKGHSDWGWGKNIKNRGFRGLWSYEAAAVAKLFDIDDSSLKDTEFYPYDLAHYKPTTIKAAERKGAIADQKEMSYEAEEDLIIDVKAIIPPCFYKHVNDFVGDYRKLSDEAFLEKYELDQIWSDLDEYAKEKNNGEILGKLLVFELVEKGYILQLDWKEDFEDYKEHMKNYWSKDGETKVITFELDNDQQYYAVIPVNNSVSNLYEIPVKELD